MFKLGVVALLASTVAFAEDKPTVSIGTVKASIDSFDVTAAKKVAKTAETKVLKCYRDHAAGVGTVATAVLKLAVDGKVSSATLTGLGQGDAAPVHNCMADALGKLRFAAPKDGAVVDITVTFTFTNADAVYGVLLGDEVGEMNGGFGFGRAGFGPGGGGTGWGTIGTGRYGTIGHGSGGYGVGGMRGPAPLVKLGKENTQGDLDKAIIRRYIRRNLRKITYCYEKELLALPKLAGTVRAQFTISSNGKVSSSAATGMNNTNVEDCVAAVIRAIEFPKPKTGEVIVNYPFTFQQPAAPPPKKTKK